MSQATRSRTSTPDARTPPSTDRQRQTLRYSARTLILTSSDRIDLDFLSPPISCTQPPPPPPHRPTYPQSQPRPQRQRSLKFTRSQSHVSNREREPSTSLPARYDLELNLKPILHPPLKGDRSKEKTDLRTADVRKSGRMPEPCYRLTDDQGVDAQTVLTLGSHVKTLSAMAHGALVSIVGGFSGFMDLGGD